MTFVLSTIGDRTYMISREQYDKINGYLEAGSPRAFRIGDSLIVLGQITGIDPIDTYKRQMKFKLAAKSLRMCDRCGMVIPRQDKCPCRDLPEKYPDLMQQAREENPALGAALDQIAAAKQIPTSL